MRPTSVKPMVEAGIMASMSILFALIRAYVPLMGALVDLIWPVPIVLLGVRHGLKWSIISTIVGGMIIAILIHPLRAVEMVLGLSLIGIALGYSFRNKKGPGTTVLIGTAASLVSKLATIGLSLLTVGINPLNTMPEAWNKAVAQMPDIYRAQGVPEEAIGQILSVLHIIGNFMVIFLPGALAIGAVLDTFVNFYIARMVLNKIGQPVPGLPPFKEWILPRWILYVFAILTGISYFGKEQPLEQWGAVYQVGINIFAMTLILIVVQGLSVFYFLADKYNLSRLHKGIILLLTFTVPAFFYATLFAGAFELAGDYRQLRNARSK